MKEICGGSIWAIQCPLGTKRQVGKDLGRKKATVDEAIFSGGGRVGPGGGDGLAVTGEIIVYIVFSVYFFK